MVRILTDSTCDLTKDRMDALGILCVPLTVQIGAQTYTDGVTLSNHAFYEKLRTEKDFPKTAQPSPQAFLDIFSMHAAQGEEIVCLLISSELSGTVQAARIAAFELDDAKIYKLDSRTACLSLGLLVEIAAKWAHEGLSGAAIYEKLESLTERIRIIAAVETLEYLKKGGRLSAAAATIGTMLNLHPIVGILDGKVVSFTKVRGKKKMLETLYKQAQADGIDTTYPILLGHGDAKANYEALCALFASVDTEKRYGEIGSVIGAHAGPGVTAVAYIKK